jgi:hypothetical protein
MAAGIHAKLQQLWLAVILISITLPILGATSPGQQDKPKDQTALITAQIVEARDYTESFVVLAKQSFAKTPADLEESQKLYASAYAKYNKWVQYVKTSLQQGQAKKLANDQDYQNIATEASGAATQFTTFVNSKTGETKAVTVVISALADLGLKLWNGIKDRQTKDRNAAADAFEKDAKWLPWQDIKAEPGK